MPNGSKMQNLRSVCLCDTVFLLEYPTYFDKKSTKWELIPRGKLILCFDAGNIADFFYIERQWHSLWPSIFYS